MKSYEKESGRKPFIGTMAGDSILRKRSYLENGCNSFDSKRPRSMLMGFWVEEDIWDYIRKYDLSYATIYDKGMIRTGCMFCMFGVHLEKGENRFQVMKRTHPKQYDYCINKLGIGRVLDTLNVPYDDAIPPSCSWIKSDKTTNTIGEKEMVKLDGVEVTQEQLQERMKETQGTGKKIVEVEPGVYKTLSKLED